MDAERQDKFLKELMSRETKEATSELSEILENNIDTHSSNLRRLISLFLKKSDNAEEMSARKNENNRMGSHDVIHIIREVLKNKLDFNNRLGGKRNILKLWQKSRAYKNEEGSIRLREFGNDYLRAGKISEALLVYNEALLFGMSMDASQ